MACYHPLHGYYSPTEKTQSGKPRVVFDRSKGYADRPLVLPCGQCIGCRLERSRQWAIRCVHESQLHADNCFVTLTYSDAHLPRSNSLNHNDWVLFFKRLRKKFGKGIRYYMCGEYGETTARPHYHACVFNLEFGDKLLYSERDGIKLYTSETLTNLWGLGHCTVGALTFQSAAYCARYIMKKVTGDKADDHYTWMDENGELHYRDPEYTQMSRRPGIGKGWLEQFQTDAYPSDFVVLNGAKCTPPKFYDRQYEIVDAPGLQKIKARRLTRARRKKHDNTPDRLRVKETCAKARINQLKRTL